MVDVYADADADTEDDADDEQVADYVHGDIQSGIRIRVERGCGHAEDVAHGRGIDLGCVWISEDGGESECVL